MQPRIVFPLGNRANFGSLKATMLACRTRGATVLPVLYASAADPRYGDVKTSLLRDEFRPALELPCHTDNAMVATTGNALIQWAATLPTLKPDVVVVVGDRHEQMAPAIAASYANVRTLHQMCGEISGSIDDKVRDAITALSDVHCAATELAANRVASMRAGANVHNTGCPRIDTAKEAIGADTARAHRAYLMVSMHPVTTEPGNAAAEMSAVLEASGLACIRHRLQMHLFWPNADAGTTETHAAIRGWLNDKTGTSQQIVVTTHRAMGPQEYARMMAGAKVLVGNSSSGLREGAWIGTPCVNVGTRQRGREHGSNVVDIVRDAAWDSEQSYWGRKDSQDLLNEAIERQIGHGPYPSSTLYGDGSAGARVAEVCCS